MKATKLSARPRCTICRLPDRWRLELLKAGGAGIDVLAAKFGVSRDAIHRHWRDHVSAEAKATYLVGPADLATLAGKAAKEGDSVIDYLRLVRTALTAQMAACSEAGDARGVAFVSNALTRNLEVTARVTGELGELASHLTINNTHNVAIMPMFTDLQQMLVRELAGDPEALRRVVGGLQQLEARVNPSPNNAILIDAKPVEDTYATA